MADFIQVNLLPIEYRIVKKDYSFLLDFRVVVPVLLVIGVSFGYFAGHSFFAARIEAKQAELAEVEGEIARNSYVLELIETREKLRNEMIAKNRSLKSISVSKKKWVRILEAINKSMPLNMWIEYLAQNDQLENQVELKGRTYVFPEVAQYMIELEKSEYIDRITLSSIELQEKAEGGSFMFSLKLEVNPNAGVDKLIEDEDLVP